MMAKEAAARSWRVILTADNPRSEDAGAIIDEMRTGLDPEADSRTFANTDRREAIRMASAMAAPGDVILIAGKGHEDYQILPTGKIHFNDREEVVKAFANRKVQS